MRALRLNPLTGRNASACWTVSVRLDALRFVRKLLRSDTLPVTALEALIILEENGLFNDFTRGLVMTDLSKLLMGIVEFIEANVYLPASQHLLVGLLQSLAGFPLYNAPPSHTQRLTYLTREQQWPDLQQYLWIYDPDVDTANSSPVIQAQLYALLVSTALVSQRDPTGIPVRHSYQSRTPRSESSTRHSHVIKTTGRDPLMCRQSLGQK